MDVQIGVTAWQLPCAPEDSLEFAQGAGLSYLQLDLGAAEEDWPLSKKPMQEKIRLSREKTGAVILSVVLNDLCQNGFVRPKGDPRREIAEETMRRGVEAAAALGVPSICVPSFFDNAIRTPADLERTAEALAALCDAAAPYGIKIYTENVLSPDELAGLFARVGRGNLRLLFDTQNYSFMAGSAAAPVFRRFKDLCGDFLHVKDGVKALGDTPLGKGAAQFTETLGEIVRAGFSGVYLIETKIDAPQSLLQDVSNLKTLLATCPRA